MFVMFWGPQFSVILAKTVGPKKMTKFWTNRLYNTTVVKVPWVPETFLARFPVSVKSL